MGIFMSTPLAIAPSAVHGTTLLTILEKVPQLSMTIAALKGGRHDDQQHHGGFRVCKDLNTLLLVSKLTNQAILRSQPFQRCHIRVSDQQTDPNQQTAMLRISKSLTSSQLTHLQVTIIFSQGELAQFI